MIRFKKLTESAIIPTRATSGSAGFDIYTDDDGFVDGSQPVIFSTGISVIIPKGYVGLIKPRSGLAFKYSIDTMAGVIDSDYRGEIKVLLCTHNEYEQYEVHANDRIAQLVVVPCMTDAIEVGDLDNTERGANGFGSTGK